VDSATEGASVAEPVELPPDAELVRRFFGSCRSEVYTTTCKPTDICMSVGLDVVVWVGFVGVLGGDVHGHANGCHVHAGPCGLPLGSGLDGTSFDHDRFVRGAMPMVWV
jgi:hypothetical protein